MNGAVTTIARCHAREAVKEELRSKGIKLQLVEASEISRAANKYIDDHPELITFATARYEDLVKRGLLRPPRKLKLLCNERSPELQGLWLCKYRERNRALTLVVQGSS